MGQVTADGNSAATLTLVAKDAYGNLVPGAAVSLGVSGTGTNTGITTLNDDSGNGRTATLNTFALTGATSNWVAGNVLSYTLSITGFSPSGGSVGGNAITITGSGFLGATGVSFNGTAATSFTVVNGTTIPAATIAA